MPRVAVSSCERNPSRPRAGRLEADDRAARVAGAELEHRPLPGRQALGDRADVVVGHVDDAFLDRLVAPAVDLAGDDLGPADLELVALAPHGLDEHRELELAPPGDLEHVGRAGVLDLDGDVAEHLPGQALAEVARREVAALLAGERRRVHAEGHPQHGLVDRQAGQRSQGRPGRRGCRRSPPRGIPRGRTGRRRRAGRPRAGRDRRRRGPGRACGWRPRRRP